MRAKLVDVTHKVPISTMATEETNGVSHRKGPDDGIMEDTSYSDKGYNLSHVKSSGGMTISPELFEKLYLTPKTASTGDFRKRFANPTPLGLMG